MQLEFGRGFFSESDWYVIRAMESDADVQLFLHGASASANFASQCVSIFQQRLWKLWKRL